ADRLRVRHSRPELPGLVPVPDAGTGCGHSGFSQTASRPDDFRRGDMRAGSDESVEHVHRRPTGWGDRHGYDRGVWQFVGALLAVLIRPSGIRPMFNALRAACFLAGMGCAIASGSRGQVLATIICGVLFFPLARRLANPRQFLTTAFGFLLVLGGIYISFNL